MRLSPDRACLVAIQIARALRFAHEAGVVHRDLKPSNVMLLKEREEGLSSDFVKVLDFGLVKVFEDEAQPARGEELELTRAGTMLGSPRYMAPEQIRCKPVDPRTDIYSLGIIMFHMLAGRPPFIGQGSVEILNQHLRTAPPAIGDVAGDDRCPLELEVIVERCLRKPPHERYPSMEELLSELKAAYRLIVNLPLRPSESYSDDLRLPTTGPEPVTPSRVFDPGTGASLEQILTGELTPAFRIDARDTSGVRAFSGSEPSYSEAIDLRPRRGPQMALLLLALVVGSLGLTLLWPRGSIGPTAGVPPRAEGPGAPPELETSSPPASAAPRVPANPARRPRTMATSGLPQPPSRSAVPAEAPRTVSAPSSGIRRKGRSRNATFNPPRRAPAAKLPRAAPPPPKPKAEPPPPSPSLLVDEVEDDAVERPEVPIVD
ncbi:MAG: protein kinase [Myxococcota bacterium]